MAEGSGFRINPAMGLELRAGHVHRDRQGRSPAPAQSHRPAGRKRAQQSTAKSTAHRVEAPELPRLRALEAQSSVHPYFKFRSIIYLSPEWVLPGSSIPSWGGCRRFFF